MTTPDSLSFATAEPTQGTFHRILYNEHFTGRQTERQALPYNFDVTIGQCVVSNRNLACTIPDRHMTPSEGEVKVCLLESTNKGS